MVLPIVVNPNESLARYLSEKKGYFSTDRNAVLPRAFMPPLNLRLSVFRIDGLKLDEVWEIGQKKVIDVLPLPKPLYGMADIKASKVRKFELEIEPSNTPPRHADICGWPEKARHKSIAQQLAAEATLILK
ncbi:MAG: hypothetical protein Q8P44_07310 [Dehalococcoidia bacterium]|nr:hypothetical protein [Dehalococcoidia bacterium]